MYVFFAKETSLAQIWHLVAFSMINYIYLQNISEIWEVEIFSKNAVGRLDIRHRYSDGASILDLIHVLFSNEYEKSSLEDFLFAKVVCQTKRHKYP